MERETILTTTKARYELRTFDDGSFDVWVEYKNRPVRARWYKLARGPREWCEKIARKHADNRL